MNRGNRASFGERPWRGLLLSVVVLIVAVAAVFGRVGGHEFLIYDDEPHLLENPRFNPVTWSGVGFFWVEQSYWGLYIPLSYTFFAAEASVAGQPLDPTIFHLGNLLLHTACVLLVFGLLRRLWRHDGAACAGALLFGLHPMQVESVAWISETRGLLCAVFSLAAIWLFDLWSAGISQSERPARVYYVLATAAFFLALLSKPAAVAVPLVAGVLALGVWQRPWRRILVGLGAWLIVAGGWVVLTKLQQPSGQMAFVPPIWARPLIAGDAAAFYLVKLVAPVQCGPDYGRSPAWVLGQWSFYVAWLLPVGLLLVLGRLRNRGVWLTAAGVFIAWLLPVLGLVSFDFQRISTVADRYVYLSLLGPALAASWLLARRWNRLTITVAAAILCVLGVLSFFQTSHWRDNEALIQHGLLVNPHSALAKQQRGSLLNRQGRHEEAIRWYREVLDEHPQYEEAYINLANSLLVLERIEEAEQTLQEAARRIPMRPPVHSNLADVLVERGKMLLAQEKTEEAKRKLEGAEHHYREAYRLDPQWAYPLLALGRLYFDRGATDEAIGLYRKALDVEPDYVGAHVNLGLALETQRRVDEARHHYEAALRIRPDWPQAHFNLANLLRRQGAIDAAESHYRAALKAEPSYAKAHVELGIILFQRGATRQAIEHYRAALQVDPKLVPAQVNLGHALAVENRHEEAAAAYRAALQLVAPDSVAAEQIRQFLQPYENR